MTLPLPSAPEISPLGLAKLLEEGRFPQLLDVRAPDKVEKGSIDLVPEERFFNVRGSLVLKAEDLEPLEIDPDEPTVVVCGHGMDSRVVASHLNKLGADATSLAGGVAAWMNLLVPRALDPPEGLDRFVQFDRIGKGCLGYLLVSQGEALIVDPPLFLQPFLDAAREADAAVVGVADTHVHADYVSGSPLLARHLSVPYYLHPGDAVYPYDGTLGALDFRAIRDGDVLEFGETALVVNHTPGHTEGSVSYFVEDRVVLTGDFLFVESLGRPDLGEQTEAWAALLWESVARARTEWDPGLAIYPAHYASPSERRMGRVVGSFLGEIMAGNPLLQTTDEEEFIRRVKEEQASFPDAYKKIKALNLGLAPIVQHEVEELEVGRNECALGGV